MAQQPFTPPTTAPSPGVEVNPPDSVGEAWEIIYEQVNSLWEGLLAHLPLFVLAIVIVILGVLAARQAQHAVRSGLARSRADSSVVSLSSRMARLGVFVGFLLLAAAVVGINITSALAVLGLAGLAIAFALQSILENFIAGLLLLMRKPFVAGDQIVTGDFEGTVDDIDFRVTRLTDYDGESILVPNAHVFSNPLINLTKRGRRRSSVSFSVDYRDDHNAVPELVGQVVAGIDGVLSDPEPFVLCSELGDSGVVFQVYYWSRPEIATVIRVRDRVTRAVKDAVEGAGMTIPWPIRTLAFDNRLDIGDARR